jgi:hypothetical protein
MNFLDNKTTISYYFGFFTVNPIIFGEVSAAEKHVICWNITAYKNMDVKLLHPVWKDFLDTVNTVVLTGYWKRFTDVLPIATVYTYADI